MQGKVSVAGLCPRGSRHFLLDFFSFLAFFDLLFLPLLLEPEDPELEREAGAAGE